MSESNVELGGVAPELEVLTPTGLAMLQLPDGDHPLLAAFVSTACRECRELLKTLRQSFAEQTIVFVVGEWDNEFRSLVNGLAVHDLGHPYDAERAYGLSRYPTVFAVRGRRLLARTTTTSRGEIAELLRDAAAEDTREPRAAVRGQASNGDASPLLSSPEK